MSPQDMEDVVLVIGIAAARAAHRLSTKCAPSIKTSRRAAPLPSPHSPRAHPPRTAVFIAAAGLDHRAGPRAAYRSSGDEGKPLAEEGKAPRESARARELEHGGAVADA